MYGNFSVYVCLSPHPRHKILNYSYNTQSYLRDLKK